jgi:hypothetical protein
MSGILRNLREQLGSGTLNSGLRYAGYTGAQIQAATATGHAGAGVGINDSLEATKQYRFRPALGPAWPGLFRDDGAFRANTAVSTTYQLYEDNVLVGSAAISVQIGAAPPPPPPAAASLAGLSPRQRRLATT